MIEIKNLKKRYPSNSKDTLSSLSVSFPDHGLFFLIGKSGSGKTTFLQLIGGMDFDYEGSIRVNGKELRTMNEDKKEDYRFQQVSFVFQNFRSEEEETVYDNLLEPLAIQNLTKEEKEERIDQVLRKVGLIGKENQTFKNLSGGEKKRISLARGLLKNSSILLADEPLASLNAQHRKIISSLLLEESKRKLVLVITHETEEIPKESSVYELKDGRFHSVKEGNTSLKKKKSISSQRKPFTGLTLFHSIFRTLISKREFFVITLFTFALALFTASFSFQLSSGVSHSLEESLSSYMSDNSLVIKPKEESYTDTKLRSADYMTLNYLKNKYPETILSISTFYLTSLDAIFKSNQDFTIHYVNRSYKMKEISLNSFLDYSLPEEKEKKIYGLEEYLENEEIILGVNEENLYRLYYLLFEEKKDFLEENDLERIGKTLEEQVVYLEMRIHQSEWNYHLNHSFRIRGVMESERVCILNTSLDFQEHFVKEVLHFQEVSEEEAIPDSVPWTLKACYGFRLFPGKESQFLRSFLKEEKAESYVPYVIDPFSIEEKKRNHVAIYQDYLPKLSLSKAKRFLNDFSFDISSVAYSSPVYTYTASGYISGFQMPFFFASKKEKLNQIMDSSLKTKENLGAFQASTIEVDQDVVKADLSSAMNQDALRFVSLNSSSPSPLYGEIPKNDHAIGISLGLAKKLFRSERKALNSTLYTLMLDETTRTEDGYQNHFSEGELKISAIYEEDRICIYQDSLFPLCYAFEKTNLTPEETRIHEMILSVDLKNHSADYYLEKLPSYDFEGDFPMLLLTAEIEKTMRELSYVFFSFSILSLISSVFLLSLSLSLLLEKDRKKIGIFLSFGYRKKEIKRFYLFLSLFIGLISYCLSLVLSVFTETVLQDTLQGLLSAYHVTIFPFMISLSVSICVSFIVWFVFSKKLNNISPIDAFNDRF